MNRQVINNFVIGCVTAFCISAVGAAAIDWKDQAVQGTILQQNTEAVKELTQAVRELQINQAAFSEKFITRSELESRLKGNRNGS